MTFEQVMERQRRIEAGERFRDSEERPVVVWSGGELLPDRASKEDELLKLMPSLDPDDEPEPPKRKYTFTGRHVGEFKTKLPSPGIQEIPKESV